MGCFQSKSNKNKAKPVKLLKHVLGEYNIRWTRLLQVKIANQLIAYQIDIEHPCFRSIEKDVGRTFPNQRFFQHEENIKIFSQTLKCFALTFPKIGYTQGLNFLCGYFLLNKMSKQQCLKILTSAVIHPRLLLIGLYEDGFPLVDLYCQMFWKILYHIDNQLYNYLRLISVADHMWIFQWYLTHFLYSFPIEYVATFLNRIFQHQQFEIVRISLGVVLCLKNGILSLQEKDDVCFIEYLDELKNIETCSRLINIDNLHKKLSSIDNTLINQSLQQIAKTKSLHQNFYLRYFSSTQKQQSSLYFQFLDHQKQSKITLEHSRKDSKLMQSYKRNRETVEILDEILLQSINKQINKKYKSSLFQTRKKSKKEMGQFRRCKSLAQLDQEGEQQGEGETTVSIVKKMEIQEDSQQQEPNKQQENK